MGNLEVRDLGINFAGLRAVNGLSFSVEDGSVIGLIGPNGAGKTTVLNCITGFYSPDEGDIYFDGIDVLKLRTNEVIKAGIARIFQNLELVSGLNVIDNVLVGAHRFLKVNFFKTAFRCKGDLRGEKENRKRAYDILEYLGIHQWAEKNVDDLPFGIRKMVEIARALISKPKLLLLDEPTAGMMPHEKGIFLNQIRELRKEFNFSILLVEHDMTFVTNMCKSILVMNFGEMIAKGTTEEVLNNPDVIKAYIGED
jgi:branched-chain amino acid transport system ATP-binding protein